EASIIRTNIALLQSEVQLGHWFALDASHHGVQDPVSYVHDGGPGRPRVVIDPDWLHWAFGHRSTSGIARFLGISRPIVREALLELGLVEPGENPFLCLPAASNLGTAFLGLRGLHPSPAASAGLNNAHSDNISTLEPVHRLNGNVHIQLHLYTSPVSQWGDDDLDHAI
ncbi:hypothetical protein BS47DRAFT_1348967, partial [Hydnum rufescens UP504]